MPDRPITHILPHAVGNRVLVKLRPSASLAEAESRAGLRPLHEHRFDAMGFAGEAQWFVAELPDGGASPWDAAHARVAGQLGVAPSDVEYVEPELIHNIYRDANEPSLGLEYDAGEECGTETPQESKNGKATGPGWGWHLGDDYSQLARARDEVRFDGRRTRIAHLDTGYSARHVTLPAHIAEQLQRNFAAGDRDDARDPNRRSVLPDNSGHGTGTLGILAGGRDADGNGPLGGAPDAEVVPLRVADRVVLLQTSAFAQALGWATDVGCDVVSMSMGGLPSRAWREEVDRAYMNGVCIVTAAGNNFRKLPTTRLVYPARYGRVIAACGVMADGKPYYGLRGGEMQGNHGPMSVMRNAMSAYTPNIPWPVFGCETKLRLNGAGTSSATPQIAAAAALWFEKYKADLPRDWQRVEAVRHALFTSAHDGGDLLRLGRGILRAANALAVRPRFGLQQTPSDNDSFAALRILTGLGFDGPTPVEHMFGMELMQRWLLNPHMQEVLEDPDEGEPVDDDVARKLLEAIIEDPGASNALREHARARYAAFRRPDTPVPVPAPRGRAPKSAPEKRAPSDADVSLSVAMGATPAACEATPPLSDPSHRELRVYAMDPGFSGRLDTAAVNDARLRVRWEALQPGPVGEYLAVKDVDDTGATHQPVNLDAPQLLARGGWTPAEGNAQFHQQMVYAVAMNTIAHFERALGRPVLWRPGAGGDYAQHLLVRPHGVRGANAYYSPARNALEFGYFDVPADDTSGMVPGSRVYTCLSHDIIVHETTHAILDGMHRHFTAPSNPDVPAFHEAFADIVALLQHFTMPELLRHEISRTRGDLEAETVLGSLAVQFGQAAGRGGALRNAIGRMHEGRWQRLEPDPAALKTTLSPHARGAILVAAVFDAFIAIYRNRSADLIRIATNGTGVLAPGAIHPDLVDRLADEATKSAAHVLTMCIRAIDYLPPVDITFFEYLRALVTADHEMVSDDRFNYRLAFVESFRRRGIHPAEIGDPLARTPRNVSVESVRWQGLVQLGASADGVNGSGAGAADAAAMYQRVAHKLRDYMGRCLYTRDRAELFDATREAGKDLEKALVKEFRAHPTLAAELGIDGSKPFHVEELRALMRTTPDGRPVPQVIVSLVQAVDHVVDGRPVRFQGGSTLVIDLARPAVKYRIVKNVSSQNRLARTIAFADMIAADPVRRLYLGTEHVEPFALMHGHAGVAEAAPVAPPPVPAPAPRGRTLKA